MTLFLLFPFDLKTTTNSKYVRLSELSNGLESETGSHEPPTRMTILIKYFHFHRLFTVHSHINIRALNGFRVTETNLPKFIFCFVLFLFSAHFARETNTY